MTLVSLIPKIYRIASKLNRLGKKYQRLDPNEKFILKYIPPGYRKAARIGVGTLLGGNIIYDIYQELTNIGSIPQKSPPGNKYQKRIGNQQYRRRRSKYSSSYNNKYGRVSDTRSNKQCCPRFVC